MDANQNMEGQFPSISLSLTERSFSITGPEDFIKRYKDILLPLVQQEQPNNRVVHSSSVLTGSQIATEGKDDQALPPLVKRSVESALIHFDKDTQLPVIQKSVPGKNKREQMRNVALILLYAAGEPLSSIYIREQCKKQSCLDPNNFSKAYETDKSNFIKTGKAGSKDWTLELTIPGVKAAETLISNAIAEEQDR